MTAVSTPYPVSGLTSLCYMSVAPQTFTPSQPHPALGICKTMVGGRKEGARRQMKGLHCLRLCVTEPMKDLGRESWGPADLPLLVGSSIIHWAALIDVSVGPGLSPFPIFR